MYNGAYNDTRWENFVRDEERRLVREINEQKGLNLNKFKKMVMLNALTRTYRR